MSNQVKQYKFEIVNGQVRSVLEFEGRKVERERVESDETWGISSDGRTVTKTEMDDGHLEVSTYFDADGDGIFVRGPKHFESATSSDLWSYPVSSPSTPFGVSSHESGYRFDVSDDMVTGVIRVSGGRETSLRVRSDDQWESDGEKFVQTKSGSRDTEYSVFADDNLDGVFQEVFEIEVQNDLASSNAERHSFRLLDGEVLTGEMAYEGDQVATHLELGRRGWKVDHQQQSEDMFVLEVNGDAFVVITEQKSNGAVEFALFLDDDNDGLWVEVAEGETRGEYLELDGTIDLVGIIDDGFLLPAAPLFI